MVKDEFCSEHFVTGWHSDDPDDVNYSKRTTFGDVFSLAPLATESLRQIKYTAQCAFIKV